MSNTTKALEAAITVERLAEHYDDRCVDLCNAGGRQRRDVEEGRLREGTLGHAKSVAGPAAYEAAQRCKELARQLVTAHAEYVAAVREWERVR